MKTFKQFNEGLGSMAVKTAAVIGGSMVTFAPAAEAKAKEKGSD